MSMKPIPPDEKKAIPRWQRLLLSPRWQRLLLSEVRSPVVADAVDFQLGIDEIVNAPTPRSLRNVHYAIIAMTVVLLALASVIEADIVVTATGRITVDTPPIMLQPLERSTIREMLVKPGDLVSKGQVLARLDPTFALADMESLATRQRSLQAQEQRLKAELGGKSFVANEAGTRDAALQQTLSSERVRQYESQTQALDEELSRLTAMLRTFEDSRASLAKQLTLAREVEKMRATLMEKEVGSRLHFLDAQNNRIRIEREFQEIDNRIAELRHQTKSKRADREAFANSWRRQSLEELVKVRDELASVTESLTKATRVHDFVDIVAPTDGIVIEVAKASVGAVLRDGEPLIHLVPSTVPLIADVMINSRDVGYAHPGDDVVIRLDAYPYHRHGFLFGRLRWISEDTFQPGQGGTMKDSNAAFHRGTVELTTTKLERPPANARITPGMTLTADIRVGRRSVIGFFLYPITNALHESLREP